MKYKKLVKAHIEDKWVESKVLCDICRHNVDGTDDSVVSLYALIGNNYPEADCRDGFDIDVCSECFLDKIKPLIESAFKIKFREYAAEERLSVDSYEPEND